MAKMPDLETFASPVRVEGPRAIGSYDLSPIARGNAAMQQGVETLGKGIQAVGTDVKDVNDANDRYALASAKAGFAIDHTNIQGGLAHDQDYPTLQPRYMEQAQAAQSRWAESLTNPAARARFNADTGQTIASGNVQIKNQAFGLEGQTKVVDLNDTGKTLSDQTIADPMNEKKFGTNVELYGDKVDALVAQGHLTPIQGDQMKDAWAHSAGVGVGLARADIDPQGALNEVRATPGSPAQLDNRIMHIEGPGKDARSSAVGGFIDSTWLDLVKSQRPNLAAGKSDSDILALRADTGLRTEMTKAYREQNTASLKAQGLPATPGNIYLSHFLGPGAAAAVLKADPKKPVADVLTELYGDPKKAQAIIDANPKVLSGQLAGSVAGWANGKMGGAIPGGGHIYDWLDDNQRRQIAGYAQNKLEANQLDQNSTLKQRIEDTATEAARTGYATNPVTQSEFVASQGVVDGPKAYAQYQAGLKTAADVSNVSRMSQDQQIQLLKSYEPQPGEGYAAAADRQDAIRKAVITVHKERDADPATFAINRVPAVKAAFSNFDQVSRDPTATPDAKSLAARDYVNKTTERQLAAGVAPEEVKIVPAPYVDGLDKALTSAATSDDPKARVGLIARIGHEKALWGDDAWPSLVHQLPPTTQPIVKAIAAGADPVAMTRLLSLGPKENPAAILKEQNEVTARNMNSALNTAFAPFKSSMVGAQVDRDFKGYEDLGSKLAAIYVRDGQSAETAADNAFKALVGNRYDFRDTFRVPKESHVDPDDVQRGAYEARQEILRGGHQASSPDQNFARNQAYLKPGQGQFSTQLPTDQEATFRDWVSKNKVPFDPLSSKSDYDMRGLWKTAQNPEAWKQLQAGGKIPQEMEPLGTRVDPNDSKPHYPDYWKTPYHETFSNESQWANDRAPHWTDDDKLVTPGGAVVFDDRAKNSSPFRDLRMQTNDMGLSDNEGDSRRNFARDGVFVTSTHNDGLNIAYKNEFLSDTSGKRILLNWDQLAKMGGTKESRNSEAARAQLGTAATP